MKVELCIPAANLNRMSVEFFHVKTTPHTPIRLATKASMAFPIITQPFVTADVNGKGGGEVYVDGG